MIREIIPKLNNQVLITTLNLIMELSSESWAGPEHPVSMFREVRWSEPNLISGME